jgi:AGCS family alanine or glycine:cation symporter
MTGLVVVNSGQWQSGANGAILTKAAFNEIPIVGPIVLFTGLLTFVFSTIIGWSYYGEKAAEYIFGSGIIKVYRYLWIVFVMLGSILTLPLVWSLADVTNGLMAIPNLVSIVVLSSIVVTETKKYLWSGKINERDEEI